MKTVSVRTLRLEWPQVERGLAQEGELVVTRDGNPVARLLPFELPPGAQRKKFSAAENARWLKRVYGAASASAVDAGLASDRAER